MDESTAPSFADTFRSGIAQWIDYEFAQAYAPDPQFVLVPVPTAAGAPDAYAPLGQPANGTTLAGLLSHPMAAPVAIVFLGLAFFAVRSGR